MSDTRDKLLESKYFLERMLETQSDRVAFIYNLSAFLAAARSVTAVMQREFDKVPGFKHWYEERQAKLQGDDTMRLLKDRRDITIHQEPIRPDARITVSVAEFMIVSDSMSVVLTQTDGAVERRKSHSTPVPLPAKAETGTHWQWYFAELPDKDIVTVCDEHMAKLDTMVQQCESRLFSQSNGASCDRLDHTG